MLSEAAKAPVPVALSSSTLQLIAGIAPTLTDPQLRVLLFLMGHAERVSNHTVRFSMREIKALTTVARSKVQLALAFLAERQYIVIRRGGATSSTVIWVSLLEVRGGPSQVPRTVENIGTGGTPQVPPPLEKEAKKQRAGGTPQVPPPSNLSLFTRAGAPVESIPNKKEQISIREAIFPQETDETRLVNRLSQARPSHFGQVQIDLVRGYIHKYQNSFGRVRNMHPPDDQLCAQVLAIAEWPDLERVFLKLCNENCVAGYSYGWYISVFADRIHGVKMSKIRDVSGRPVPVSSQSTTTLDALSRRYAPPREPEDVGAAPGGEPEPLPALAGLGNSGEVPALPETAGGPCVKCGTAAASENNSRGYCARCEYDTNASWCEAQRAQRAPKRKAGW